MTKEQAHITIYHRSQDGYKKPEAVTIFPATMRQINRSFAAVSAILDGLAENPELERVVYNMFLGGEEFIPENYPEATPEQLKIIEQEYKDRQETDVAMAVLKSSKFLLVRLPEEMAQLVSAMSDIDVDLLLDQEPEEFADALEAITEVNDLPKIWNRAKAVFGLTAAAFRPKKKEAKAETPKETAPLQ